MSKQDQKGFGLLEVIIAVFIVAVGLVGILSLASMSLKGPSLSKNRLIASGLAQEGIEIVRDIRKSNVNWGDWEWYGSIATSTSQSYRVQYDNTSLTMPYSGAYLRMNANGLYQYDSGVETIFKRKVTLTKNSCREVKVGVEVQWDTKGQTHTLTAEDKIMELEIKNKGFTLIEVLVAMAIFSLMVVAMSATAVSMIKSQRKSFALQNSQENARYILESISKEIRMSVIDSGPGDGLSSLNITNAESEDVDYRFVGQKLQRQVDGGGWQDLNPTDLEIAGSFYIRKSASLPVRAVVTLIMHVKAVGGQVEEEAEIYLQSTISSRAF